MTGIEKIAKERNEQLVKHHRSIISDVELNQFGQLSFAASILSYQYDAEGEPFFDTVAEMNKHTPPLGWGLGIWQHMLGKDYEERLTIAGALIAAELDRLDREKQIENSDDHE